MANQFKEAAEKKRLEAERKRQEAEAAAKKAAEEAQAVGVEPDKTDEAQPVDMHGVFGVQGKKRHERKTANLNILLKPSVKERLKEDSDKGIIKSANDVINTQLDKYYAVRDAIASGQVKSREELEAFVIREYLDK